MRAQLRAARRSGELQPTVTVEHEIEDGGIVFHVRVIAGRDHKRRSLQQQAVSGEDPFRPPYGGDLFVADLSPTHVALLNKFPVLADHLLVVTRADEPQQSWLTLRDFEALAACMLEVDGLGFYNGGSTAGSSQPHKHLQLVPMPVTTWPLFAASDRGFACAVRPASVARDGVALHAAYRDAMAELGVDADRDPYNVLVTRERLVVVPRTRHAVDGLFLNAMGYAGSLLVRDAAQLERLREIGPRRLLAEAGRPL
jgi:ATP adenylyltransferase